MCNCKDGCSFAGRVDSEGGEPSLYDDGVQCGHAFASQPMKLRTERESDAESELLPDVEEGEGDGALRRQRRNRRERGARQAQPGCLPCSAGDVDPGSQSMWHRGLVRRCSA